jgi:peptidoglycan hydrolase-like protein with peptidoglycan-binding domain
MRLHNYETQALIENSFAELFGRQPTRTERQGAQAVALIETDNGQNWHAPGVGSNNMGAIQAGSNWAGAWFAYGDTHPQTDGTSKPYAAKFRRYDTPAAGFTDLVRVLYLNAERDRRVLPFATRGDWLGFSTGLHQAPAYFEGRGADDEERIAHHCAAVIGAIERIAFDLGEPGPDIGLAPASAIIPAFALCIGCHGPAVCVWQGIIRAEIDGAFGGETQTLTRVWQLLHGLPPSGVVGAAELKKAGLVAADLPF